MINKGTCSYICREVPINITKSLCFEELRAGGLGVEDTSAGSLLGPVLSPFTPSSAVLPTGFMGSSVFN